MMILIAKYFLKVHNQLNSMAFRNYIRNVIIICNQPLRPIVSSIGAYNYNLAKYLSSLLVPLLPDKYSVKDSFSFVEELRSFDFNDKFLISFDVESLFTNIPLNETIDIAVHLIFKHNPKFSIKKNRP